MNEPKRLLDSGSKHLRALVEAGKGDQPDHDLHAKVLGTLGLGAAGGAWLIAGASGGLTRSGISRFFGGLWRATLSKTAIAVVAVATASSAGYLAVNVHERARDAATASATSTAPVVAPVPSRPPAREPGAAGIPVRPVASMPVTLGTASAESLPIAPPSPLPSVGLAATIDPQFGSRGASMIAGGSREGSLLAGAAATAPAHRSDDASPAPPAQAATVAPAIAVQLESIRHARALIAVGNARAALVELDAYGTLYPYGIFEEEAMALRVRALRMAGDPAGAERERVNLKAQFPKSVHLAALGN